MSSNLTTAISQQDHPSIYAKGAAPGAAADRSVFPGEAPHPAQFAPHELADSSAQGEKPSQNIFEKAADRVKDVATTISKAWNSTTTMAFSSGEEAAASVDTADQIPLNREASTKEKLAAFSEKGSAAADLDEDFQKTREAAEKELTVSQVGASALAIGVGAPFQALETEESQRAQDKKAHEKSLNDLRGDNTSPQQQEEASGALLPHRPLTPAFIAVPPPFKAEALETEESQRKNDEQEHEKIVESIRGDSRTLSDSAETEDSKAEDMDAASRARRLHGAHQGIPLRTATPPPPLDDTPKATEGEGNENHVKEEREESAAVKLSKLDPPHHSVKSAKDSAENTLIEASVEDMAKLSAAREALQRYADEKFEQYMERRNKAEREGNPSNVCPDCGEHTTKGVTITEAALKQLNNQQEQANAFDTWSKSDDANLGGKGCQAHMGCKGRRLR